MLRKRALVTFFAAVMLATVMTAIVHRWENGTSTGFLGEFGGATVYINQLLGTGPPHPFDPTPEDLADPEIRLFLETVKTRVQPYLGNAGSKYDVWMMVPQRRGAGWPFKSRVLSALVCIHEYTAAGELQPHVFFADATGAPPFRMSALVGNWLFYFVAIAVLVWLLFAYAPVRKRQVDAPLRRKPPIAFLRIERRWHWPFVGASAILLGFIGACYTHTKVTAFQRVGFAGQFDDVYLNAMMGLPSDHLPAELDPLSGIVPADPQLIAFCEKLAEQARPYVKEHPSQCTVYVMLTSHTARGWPFRSSIPAATLIINDESLGGSYGREYKFEVDADGNPAFKWQGAIGNTLIFAAAAFPFAWGFFALLAWILDRLTRPPHAFPVVVANGEQAEEEA